MDHYAGIDVSLEYSSVCVVDTSGKIVREAKVASEPEALIAWFGGHGLAVERLGWFRPVHCKSMGAQETRTLLTARKLVQSKLRDVENSLRGILRGFGLKVGKSTDRSFAGRIRELVPVTRYWRQLPRRCWRSTRCYCTNSAVL